MKRTPTALLLTLGLLAAPVTAAASLAEHIEAQAFALDMEARHGFDRNTILATLGQAQHEEQVIRLIRPPSKPGVRSWQRYRGRFLDSARIQAGVAFWHSHAERLREASERYGVPPEIIAAIIGVETHYGRNTGNFGTVAALATLAFDYPPRAELFRRELEHLFLLAREQGRDPIGYYGSYAGAIGYPQFLPSSIRSFAVDFDGNGQIDFDTDPADAIGSVANYLAQHGWIPGAPIAVPALVSPGTDPRPLIDAGIEPTLGLPQLAAAGITPATSEPPDAPATFIDLETPGAATEYWLGYRNFYVITRYNKSSFYAMAVFELATALRETRQLELSAR